MARANPDRQRELDELRLVCLTLIDWFSSVADGFAVETATSFRAGIDAGFERRSLTGLRMARNDLVAMVQDVPAGRRSGLDLLLRERTGSSLEQLLSKQAARVQRILRAGKVRSQTQYYLLREHLDFVANDPLHGKERQDIQRLMDDFEQSQSQRHRRPDSA